MVYLHDDCCLVVRKRLMLLASNGANIYSAIARILPAR